MQTIKETFTTAPKKTQASRCYKVLITGVSGFLGHHVLKECHKRGWFTVGVDKRPIPPNHEVPRHFIQADVNDLGFRDLMGVDYVIHLAFATNIPNSVRHPEETTKQNIDMTVHLLEVCRDTGIKKFLFPSTASLYSNNPTPWTEDMPAFPIEPYSWHKLACEYACLMYSKSYKLPCVVLRFFQVYGELQRDDTAIAAFLKSKKEGRPITLTETTAQSTFRSGQRDFIYAGDLAEAVCVAVDSELDGEILNVASGKITTMEEVAEAIGAEITWIPKRPWEVEQHLGDISKIKKLLGWESKTDVISWLKSVSTQP